MAINLTASQAAIKAGKVADPRASYRTPSGAPRRPWTTWLAPAKDVAKQFAESDAKGDLRPLRDLFLEGASRELGAIRRALPSERAHEFKALAKFYEAAETAGPDDFEQAVRNFAAAVEKAQAAGWKLFVDSLRSGGQ